MGIIIVSATLVVVMTIGSGLFLIYQNTPSDKAKMKKVLKINLFSFIPMLIAAMIIIAPGMAGAQGETVNQSANGLGYLAAALSTGMATIGTGYAVGVVGSSALGAVSEDSKILGKTLIFVGLAEGIAIYGLIISILILGRLS